MKFSRSQRNGLLVLSFLMVFSFTVPRLFLLYKKETTTDFSAYEKEINLFYQTKTTQLQKKSKENIKLFKFNPNTSSWSDFLDLGLSPRQAKQLINYRNKGGVFRTKSDFSKMYAIDDSTYRRLAPYLLLPSKKQKKNSKAKSKKEYNTLKKTYKPVRVNINIADTQELQKIKGIGAVLSKRIVAFREKLGGFYIKSQLLEVYGIQKEAYEGIASQVFVQGTVEKLNMNFSTASELSRHPYINKSLAKQIVKERSMNGAYTDIDNFISRNKASLSDIEKLKPYILF